MFPGFVAARAISLAESIGDPPPKPMTKSQFVSFAFAAAAIMLSVVGLGSISSKTSKETPDFSNCFSISSKYPNLFTEPPLVMTIKAFFPGKGY